MPEDNITPPPGFTPLNTSTSQQTPHAQRTLIQDLDGDGPMPTPEEQRLMIQKWREEQAARKGKAKRTETSDLEAQARAKKKKADELRLQALQLQREEIELQERALRESLEAEDVPDTTEGRKEKRRCLKMQRDNFFKNNYEAT